MNPLSRNPRESFPRENRLHTGKEFGQVFAQPRRLQSAHFVVRYKTTHEERTNPRLGMAISRRHARRAIDRNRVKRVIRETFRQMSEQLGSVDVVVLSRPDIAKAENQVLRAEMQKMLQRVP